MSFLKDLFEKRKDKKYGKGHRLGETPTQQPSFSSSSTPRPSSSSQQNVPRSDAAQKAAEAALQRLENSKRPSTSAVKRQVSKEVRQEAEAKNQELEKALKLKEHYFGKPRLVEDSTILPPKNQIYFTASILNEDEKYPASQIEDRIEQLLLEKLAEEPILVACTLLRTANYKNQEKLDKCVEILNKYADNITSNPSEEKYRKIRIENAIFKEKVFSLKYSDLLLKQVGFKTVSIEKESDGETKQYEDYFVFEGDNLDPLNSLKSCLSLAEPIKPELDRDIRVYRMSNDSNKKLADFDLSEDFYNLKVEELRREQALRNETLEKNGMLRTKQMRERDEQLELRRYNYCLIRVKFPNSLILQALFKANEKYQTLHQLVNDCLEIPDVPFELFSHSLRHSKSDLPELTLAEAGLAPAALLNFKFSEGIDESVKSCFDNFLHSDLMDNVLEF